VHFFKTQLALSIHVATMLDALCHADQADEIHRLPHATRRAPWLTTMLKFLRHADRAERTAKRDSQPGVFSEPPDLVGAWSWKVSQK
jgi:hypothetical protein